MTEAADSNTHWITAYLLHLDQQRNYSDRTLNAYRRDLIVSSHGLIRKPVPRPHRMFHGMLPK